MLKKITFTGALFAFAIFCSGQNNKNDEPDELSWEFFSGKQKCFDNFVDWSKQNESLLSDALVSAGKNNFLKPLPATFKSVSIFPKAFPKRKGRIIQSKINGEKIIQLPAGHTSEFVRTVIDIPETGLYRIWIRYYHTKGRHNTFNLRLLPSELNDCKFKWQSSAKGCFFDYRYDEAKFRYKVALPTRKNNPTGFIWEGAPLIRLKAGRYSLELRGCIHAGGYARRQISNILITQDPLFVPAGSVQMQINKILNNGVLSREVEPSGQTRKNWELWQLRPGRKPLVNTPVKIANMWEKWRSQLIAFLASGKAKGLEYECMADMVYFNKDYNLIGTPAQVAKYILEAKSVVSTLSASRNNKWFYAIEAENMKKQLGVQPWKVAKDSNASGGVLALGTYGDLFSGASTLFSVPAEGEYRIWVRHKNLKKYYSIFHIGFRRPGNTKNIIDLVFGDEADKKNYPATGMYWGSRKIKLSKGKYEIQLFKKRGKLRRTNLTYRRVDRIVVTNDLTWKPEKTGMLPSQGEIGKNSIAVWRQVNTWNGFSQNSIPLPQASVDPEQIKLEIQPGEVASCLLLLRNNTLNMHNITPVITGNVKSNVNWRVVAYVLSTKYDWQPQPLLFRSSINVPPKRNTALWLTIDGRKLSPGEKSFVLKLGKKRIKFAVTIKGKNLAGAPTPFVGGWSAPFCKESAWEMYSDIGLNVIHRVVIPKIEMEKLNIRLFNLIPASYKNISPESVKKVINAMQSYNLSYKDWTWEIFDEPGDKSVARWVDAAKKLNEINPEIQRWCNPGEIQSSSAKTNLKMMPYINVYCPYFNHFAFLGAKVPGYLDKLAKTGRIKLLYTTPCLHEKAPHAPWGMFGLAEAALKYNRDGWNFFSLLNYYGSYSHSPWDDVNAPFPDQSVSIYPGAYGQTISTRNLEAVRGAIQMWKKAKLKKQ
jgi:hypothetical protein